MRYRILYNTEKIRLALALAVETGNVSGACREAGISRQTFYKWRRRLGERACPPGETPPAPPAGEPAWKELALSLCLEFPEWGCDRLSCYLALKGHPVSSPTVQKLLIRNGLGRAEERRLRASGHAAPDPCRDDEDRTTFVEIKT